MRREEVKKTGIISAALVAALLAGLSGCGGQADNRSAKRTPESKASVSSSAVPDAAGPKLNERGNLVKKIGEEAGAYAADGKTDVATWTVTGVQKDFACTVPNPMAPSHGHFVALDASVATTPALKAQFGFGNGSTWQYIKKDGTVWNEDPESIASAACVPDADHLPNDMGPGLKASGKVIFDLPDTDGYLVFPYVNEEGQRTTWEYPLS